MSDTLQPGKSVLLQQVSWEDFLAALQNTVQQSLEAGKKKDLEERFLSPAEACKVFQPAISKNTLSKWTRAGSLQEHRIGGRVYYKYGEILASTKTLKRYSRNY